MIGNRRCSWRGARRLARESDGLEAGEGSGVLAAGEEAVESEGKGRVRDGIDGVEEGKRGVELEIVGVGEDLLGGALGGGSEGEGGALAEARAKGGVGEVGEGFRAAGDGEVLGGGGGAEAANLGKDEPHPVRSLEAGGELGVDLRVDGGLGVEEALEVVGIGGWRDVG